MKKKYLILLAGIFISVYYLFNYWRPTQYCNDGENIKILRTCVPHSAGVYIRVNTFCDNYTSWKMLFKILKQESYKKFSSNNSDGINSTWIFGTENFSCSDDTIDPLDIYRKAIVIFIIDTTKKEYDGGIKSLKIDEESNQVLNVDSDNKKIKFDIQNNTEIVDFHLQFENLDKNTLLNFQQAINYERQKKTGAKISKYNLFQIEGNSSKPIVTFSYNNPEDYFYVDIN